MWSHKEHERGTVLLQMLVVVDWCAGEINRTTYFRGETGDTKEWSKMYITHPV